MTDEISSLMDEKGICEQHVQGYEPIHQDYTIIYYNYIYLFIGSFMMRLINVMYDRSSFLMLNLKWPIQSFLTYLC
jgi:hypothetical protein